MTYMYILSILITLEQQIHYNNCNQFCKKVGNGKLSTYFDTVVNVKVSTLPGLKGTSRIEKKKKTLEFQQPAICQEQVKLPLIWRLSNSGSSLKLLY